MCSLNTPRTPHFAGQVELFAPNERENKIKTKEKSPKFWAFSMCGGGDNRTDALGDCHVKQCYGFFNALTAVVYAGNDMHMNVSR